jgi:hypothetical protein
MERTGFVWPSRCCGVTGQIITIPEHLSRGRLTIRSIAWFSTAGFLDDEYKVSRGKQFARIVRNHAPARVHQNDFLSSCQVETNSSGLQTNKKYFTPRIIFQSIESLGTFFTFHGTIQAIITDFINQQGVFNPKRVTIRVILLATIEISVHTYRAYLSTGS